jgi:Protein of unknown function (DUF2771)
VRSKRLVPLLLVGAGVAVTGCSAPPLPAVTFFADGHTASTGPARYCAPRQVERCPLYDSGAVLTVPSNKPLQISVPSEVGSAPWQVTFTYRDANGKETAGRSEAIKPDDRMAYTLIVPSGQLEHVEVQRYSPVLISSADGVGFPIGATWVLTVKS